MSELEFRKGSCPVCSYACYIRAHIKDGNITRITGDPGAPRGKQLLCERAVAGVDYHYHPDRLNFPLKRVGERGEGKWQQITWKQAMDEIAQKLDMIRKQVGPEAVAVLGGDNMSSSDPAAWRWCNLWGTPNMFNQGKNCGESEVIGECAIYGYTTLGSPGIGAIGKKGLIVIWGANPWASRENLDWAVLTEAKKSGSKFVVIDPRLSGSAKEADIWVQLRPGTDGALAFGMLNVIINNGLYDKDFVSRWCLGFDKLKALVQKYSPERVEEITWVPRKQIIEFATLYATTKPAAIYFGVSTTHIGKAGLSAVAGKAYLRAITGNLDVEGGNAFCPPPDISAYREELHWDKLINNPLRKRDNVSAHVWPIASVKALKMFREAQSKVYPRGAGMTPYFVYPGSYYLWSAVLEQDPYPIKAIILGKSNPLLVLGNARRIYRALKSPNLDLLVTMDRWMTPSAQLSDYVLPGADNLERPEVDNAWGWSNNYFARPQAVEPLYERRDDYNLWRELGTRLDQKEYWPDTLEQWYDRILKPTGVTFKELSSRDNPSITPPREFKLYEKNGFGTFSGKVELTSSIFEKMGLPDIPDYEEPAWSPVRTPELAKEYPLILISGARVRSLRHSQHRQLDQLRRRYPSPMLDINPSTAAKLGIAQGDTIYVETPLGRVRQKANLTTGIDPRVVHADGYWWYPEMPATEPTLYGVWESNINAILPDSPEVCDFTGDNYFRGLLCRVYKSKEL